VNRSTAIQALLDDLSSATTPDGLRNPYHCPVARSNLATYLDEALRESPQFLLVGEAPGYRGAAITGVPFTSTEILTTAWRDPWGVFGPSSFFRCCVKAQFSRESTATMIWSSLAEIIPSQLPLLWNAVPFHPGPSSAANRPVTPRDIAAGTPFLQAVVALAPQATVLAVGRSASLALDRLGTTHLRLRHPSHGGKREFHDGLARLAYASETGPTNSNDLPRRSA
jgi:uracil-DNA glycosylase